MFEIKDDQFIEFMIGAARMTDRRRAELNRLAFENLSTSEIERIKSAFKAIFGDA